MQMHVLQLFSFTSLYTLGVQLLYTSESLLNSAHLSQY